MVNRRNMVGWLDIRNKYYVFYQIRNPLKGEERVFVTSSKKQWGSVMESNLRFM